MTKEIYIIRHGQTDYNLKGVVQGRGVDASLNENGIAQSKSFYKKYGDTEFDLIISSALKRTQETISHFFKNGQNFEIRPEIDEISWGIYEGLHSSPEMKLDYFNIVNSWLAGNLDHKTEEGESPLDLQNRLLPFIDEMRSRDYKRALVCTHGRTLRVMLCTMMGVDLTRMDEFDHANLTLYIVGVNENGFEVMLKNCTQHL